MEKNDIENKIKNDPDFIRAPKFENSLQKLLVKMDNPLENNAIGRLLLLSPEEVEEIYQESIEKLKKEINSDGEQD